MAVELYGFVMLDFGHDFGQIGDPKWEDTLRPTKLPAFDDQFGRGDRQFAGVRQTRFGVKATIPNDFHGDITTKFEFEMFGTGVDAGQTTIRLRHAYGDWWQLRAGQTWSPFMDIDVFPNSVEYWGPPGMAFYRNVQLAWMPIRGDSRVTNALERPGGSADKGDYSERVELTDVVPRFPAPDLSAEGRWAQGWGYVEAAGIVRYLKWDDLGMEPGNISGKEWAWGVNLSTNLELDPALLKVAAVYGHGIANYMNDATSDIAPADPFDPAAAPGAPIDGKAIPLFGVTAFADINWSDEWTSTAGYSMIWMDNTDGQAPDAFHVGHYALGNILYHPSKYLFFGPEFQWGRRVNKDDFSVDDYRLQISVRYDWNAKLGGD